MGVLSFLFVCCKLLVFLSESSFASDTITSSQSLSDGRTLVSKEGSFELGFFSPGSSKNRYVGICQNKSVVWSANLSKEVRIPVVLQLLDSGNLVLRGERDGGSETYLWQSFDYPSDTLLPGMKLGWDLKTGLERRITSWKSPDDPSPGNFTWAVERQDNPELMMWKGSRKFQRSGPWNGLKFSATSLRPNPIFNFSFVSNEDELYFTIDLIDKAVFSRIVMNQTLYLRQRFTWDKATQSWELDLCDTYALCGAYGICIISGMPVCQCLKGFKQKSRGYVDWSQGCVRDKSLNYSRQDGFIKFTAMKLPDATRSWVSKSMNLNECWEKCLDDSSCMAYTNSYIRGEGSGCAMWFGELIDMRDFPDAGQDLYIRMSASEIEYADQGAKSKPTTKIVVIVVPTAALLAAVLIAGYLIHKRRRNIVVNIIQYFRENRNMDLELPLFELATIANATDNFSINNKLGEGGFGLVYKGEEKLLIYEFMPNKSLNSFIFGLDQERCKILDWSKRFHIICGTARGVMYLHQDSKLRIIHRDLKASNVLLDQDMNPKISDFGLARAFGGDETEGNTKRVIGTYGYMAPEYASDGQFSVKSDVFSFGILLLEIISGKKNRGFYHSDNKLNLIGHSLRLEWAFLLPLSLRSQKWIRDAGGFTGVNPPMPKELPIWSSVYWDGPEVPFSVWGDFYLSVGLYEHIHCISGLTSRLASYNVLSVPVYSRKLIAYESDEETEDSSLNLSIPTDFLHPSSSVGPSHGRDTLEYPRLLATSPSSELELVGNRGGPASGSGENHSSGGVGVPEEVGDGEGSSSEASRPPKKRNLGHKEILLVVPGKCDVPSRPPRGYVTMHLESFKLGARLSLQRYFAKILGGMHLAPGQLHPNGWRVLSAMYVLWERCGSEEPSLVEVKHLYQRRSSPKEAGWYYFMSSSAKRKPITGFPSSCKNWKNKLFFAGGKWCTAARSLGGDIYLPTHFVTPESWGLVKDLEDRPLLQVKTALVNASTCQDLLSPTNLVCSGLVDIAAGMDNKILSAMTRKRGRAPSSSSNPPPLPKKANVGQPKVSVPTLPLPPPRKNGGEKVSDKSPEISIQSGDRSSPLPSRDQGDYLSPYQKDYGKSVGPKMVKDIESMNLSELAGSLQRVSFKLATLVSCYKNRSIRHERRLQADNQDLKKKAESADRSKEKLLDLHKQIMDLEEKLAMAESTSVKLENELGDLKSDLQATQSERDTLKTTLEGEIKSLNEQLAEAKGKSADVDDRLDAEYNSGVGFCYKCIMFVLKEEYPELNMSKLEDGVQKYMAEVDQGNKEQGDQDQVKAPLGGVQAAEAGDRAPEVGQGSLPPPLDVADPLLPEIADPSTVEAANPHNL
ncbi:Receptor-like serine/threonine-protein kinase SD1-8 [Citrus sinensis]|uniref:Receptor-like serine/threonine-protein kinase SD1-8 n=1 Tax=Citrus sinensis TaxID=2711 RepID=A0ACB8NZ22_CITSI|nr:Receptor-like serine/threonine-protein kinase SD1-8 [Citrus sinensis]